MTKKNKLPKFIIGGLILLIALSGAIYYYGFDLTFGAPQNCEDSRYNDNCYCDEGFEKRNYDRFLRNTLYYCENENKFIDIDQEGWEDVAKQQASEKMAQLFPDCNMADCDLGGAYLETLGGFNLANGKRGVRITCYTDKSDNSRIPHWELLYLVETGELFEDSYYCSDYKEPIQVQEGSPAIIEQTSEHYTWYSDRVEWHRANFEYVFGCESGNDASESMFVFEVREDMRDKISTWEIGMRPDSITEIPCEILEEDSNTVRFSCDAKDICDGNEIRSRIYLHGTYS